MQRFVLSLTVILLACLAISAAPSPEEEDAEDYIDRGLDWYSKGEYDKAIAAYNAGLRLVDPKEANHLAAIYCNRGDCWNDKGEYEKAIADYNQALVVDAKYAEAYNSLAWLQATCEDAKFRNGQKAVENAGKAYQLSEGKEWRYVDTLAAACAESGDFAKARLWQAKAIKMAAADKSATDDDKEEALSCLELGR